jgi:hypothetical protein
MRRLQRQRRKGWRMPEGAVYVGRPSLWGNPWSLRDIGQQFPVLTASERPAVAVWKYRQDIEAGLGLLSDFYEIGSEREAERHAKEIDRLGISTMAEYAAIALRGKDLVCWCPLDQPCHADVLLELANR